MAVEITDHYRDRELTVVSILKGSCIFVADLVRRLPIPLELAFVSASSYRSGTKAGRLELNFFPTEGEIKGKNLLLVDDILDTGKTMAALRTELLMRGAAEVRSCTFLDKPSRRETDVAPDFRVFEVEDLFVVGYGLDYAGHYRNLPVVGHLKEEVYAQESS